nr:MULTISPECIES: GDSL lipase [unclassified Mycobacterium]
MSRVAALVVALGLLVTIAWAPQHGTFDYQLATRETPMFRIAVVGDSYTTGGGEGGLGSKGWTTTAWQQLARQGVAITADVGAEGGAGYVVPGNRGSVFEGLANNVVRPDDALVVFYGSRNDQGVDPATYFGAALGALNVARRVAPSAPLLVIGPPWPTADVPPSVTTIRDVLSADARAVGATFIDPIAERWFVGRPELIGPDGVHPTDAGHAFMADRIAPLIAAQLAGRG